MVCLIVEVVILSTPPYAVQTALNKAAAEAMLISASILRLGTSKAVAHGIDDDSRDRIVTSLKVRSIAQQRLQQMARCV